MKIKRSQLNKIIKEEYNRLFEDVKSELEQALKTHDWWYKMSDDHRWWEKGTRERKYIFSLIPQVDKKTAQQLWNKYSPQKHSDEKRIFKFPEHLYKK